MSLPRIAICFFQQCRSACGAHTTARVVVNACVYAHASANHACTQSCLYTIMPVHNYACTQSCLYTIMPVHNHACKQSCVYTIMPAHNHACTHDFVDAAKTLAGQQQVRSTCRYARGYMCRHTCHNAGHQNRCVIANLDTGPHQPWTRALHCWASGVAAIEINAPRAPVSLKPKAPMKAQSWNPQPLWGMA